jgi:hypothetical protein
MQAIVYGGEEFLTGDEIADALLSYGRALGDEGRAELVEIPVHEQDGAIVAATFLIGPASQIVAKVVLDAGSELEDAELVERLRALTRGVESPEGGALEMPDTETYHLD